MTWSQFGGLVSVALALVFLIILPAKDRGKWAVATFLWMLFGGLAMIVTAERPVPHGTLQVLSAVCIVISLVLGVRRARACEAQRESAHPTNGCA
jgi:hypothetical protein